MVLRRICGKAFGFGKTPTKFGKWEGGMSVFTLVNIFARTSEAKLVSNHP